MSSGYCGDAKFIGGHKVAVFTSVGRDRKHKLLGFMAHARHNEPNGVIKEEKGENQQFYEIKIKVILRKI